ncbi:hypothetical protein GCM10027034_38170 [Ramlibacter solisilvae]|uniref:Uncharacterized protein n=1 Tax=Ramlibacter tataouinensis TaxID=94132 RepID=A0A127JUS3_9BURK|nr:hypothetical protein [Ramlibacter tataouinensis]AMO23633.1 hypothetical protein UC35_12970 [Ramlibacter tataouinensis]
MAESTREELFDMHNLTLTISELKQLLRISWYVTLALGAVILGVIWLAQGTVGLGDGFRAFSTAVAISLLIVGGVHQASWKREWLARWIDRPVVHGVWCGTLTSDYKATSGIQMKIPIVFVIRQTYLSLSVQSFTRAIIGTSKLEGIVQDARNLDTRLRYVFEMTRLFNNENKVTKGSGELRLQNRSTVLHGFYWTSTPTHGELRLKLVSRDCEEVDCFEVALEKWPDQLSGGVAEVPVPISSSQSIDSETPVAASA